MTFRTRPMVDTAEAAVLQARAPAFPGLLADRVEEQRERRKALAAVLGTEAE